MRWLIDSLSPHFCPKALDFLRIGTCFRKYLLPKRLGFPLEFFLIVHL